MPGCQAMSTAAISRARPAKPAAGLGEEAGDHWLSRGTDLSNSCCCTPVRPSSERNLFLSENEAGSPRARTNDISLPTTFTGGVEARWLISLKFAASTTRSVTRGECAASPPGVSRILFAAQSGQQPSRFVSVGRHRADQCHVPAFFSCSVLALFFTARNNAVAALPGEGRWRSLNRGWPVSCRVDRTGLS